MWMFVALPVLLGDHVAQALLSYPYCAFVGATAIFADCIGGTRYSAGPAIDWVYAAYLFECNLAA
jgi:hypothetical protein